VAHSSKGVWLVCLGRAFDKREDPSTSVLSVTEMLYKSLARETLAPSKLADCLKSGELSVDRLQPNPPTLLENWFRAFYQGL
jgi:hypothetical protein